MISPNKKRPAPSVGGESDQPHSQSQSALTYTVDHEDDPVPVKQYSFGGFADYMSSKKQKLKVQEQELQDVNPSGVLCDPVFQGLSIHVNPACQQHSELRRLISRGGGDFEHYLSKRRVDFIVAPSLTNKKLHEFRNYKVVHPDFITESVAAGRRLTWTNYRITAGSHDQKGLDFGQNTPETTEREADKAETDISEGEHDISAPTIVSEKEVDESRRSASPPNTSGHQLTKWALRQTSTSADFLTSFYQQSRLHWLSTWKLELQDMVGRLYEERDSGRSNNKPQLPQTASIFQQQKPLKSKRRVIMHVDMDCFFPSVAIRDRPELKDKPVAVCHSQGTTNDSSSEIASCNYVARSFGVKNGSYLGGARKKCPSLIVVPYEFDKYKECTAQIYKILLIHADELQAVSCDEALLDVSTLIDMPGTGQEEKLATTIRDEIHEATRCEASIGIASNIMLARMATKKAKPHGQYFLKDEDVEIFLKEKEIRSFPGVGRSLEEKLAERGLMTVHDLLAISKVELQNTFGPKTGTTLYNFARGIDDRPLIVNRARQSIGADISWGVRFEDDSQVEKFITDLAEEVSRRMAGANGGKGARGKCITFKIKKRAADQPMEPIKFLGSGICDSFSKSVTLSAPTCDATVIARECIGMMKQYKFENTDIRGIGITLHKLEIPKRGVTTVGGTQQGTLKFQSSKPDSPENDTSATLTDAGPSPSVEPPRRQMSPITTVAKSGDDTVSKPELQIERSQFDEFPEDIKKELLSYHTIVFVDNHAPGPSISRNTEISPADMNRVQTVQASTSRTSEYIDAKTPLNRILSNRKTSGLPSWFEVDPESLLALPNEERRRTIETYAQDPGTPHQEQLVETPSQCCRPSWVRLDPSSLLALPDEEIRTIVAEYARKGNSDKPQCSDVSLSRPEKDSNQERVEALPSPSTLDLEVLAALPPSLRKQIQDGYKRNSSKDKARPPTPGKLAQKSPPKAGGATKRNAKRKGDRNQGTITTLTQWSRATTASGPSVDAFNGDDTELLMNSQGEIIDATVLAALPPDLREEIVRKHRQRQRQPSPPKFSLAKRAIQ